MDQDLKDTIKKLEEAKTKQEKIEKIIIILSGLLIIVIFSVIGINIYSGKNETISEPEIDIIAERTPKNPEEDLPLHKNFIETKPADTKNELKKSEIQKKETIQEKDNKKINTTQKQENSAKTVNNKKSEKKKTEKKIIHPQKGFYYIQMGAFSSRKKAEKFVSSLNLKNIYIIEEKGLHKVLLGKFKNRKEAYRFMREKDLKGFVRKL
jgi:cell division septation protein DedD